MCEHKTAHKAARPVVVRGDVDHVDNANECTLLCTHDLRDFLNDCRSSLTSRTSTCALVVTTIAMIRLYAEHANIAVDNGVRIAQVQTIGQCVCVVCVHRVETTVNGARKEHLSLAQTHNLKSQIIHLQNNFLLIYSLQKVGSSNVSFKLLRVIDREQVWPITWASVCTRPTL